MKKKLLVLLLSTCLAVQSLPVHAVEPEENLQPEELQDETDEETEDTEEEDLNGESTELQKAAEEPELIIASDEELPDCYMYTEDGVTYWAESPEILQEMLSEQGITDYRVHIFSMDDEEDEENRHPVTLEAPTGLRWDSVTPGHLYWSGVKGSEGFYMLEIYKDGELYKKISWYGLPDKGEAKADMCENFEESGAYKFRVRAGDLWGSDGTPVSAWSEWSPEWVYVKPERQLAAPQGVIWQKTTGKWNAVSGAGGYYTELLFGDGTMSGHLSHNPEYLSQNFSRDLERKGEFSNCYFHVKAISENVEKISHSNWSRKSSTYGTDGAVNIINDALRTAIEDMKEDPDQALEKLVNDTDVDEMAVAMNTESQTLDLIQELESTYAEKKNISVTTQTDAYVSDYLDPEQISVVGAALNAASSDQEMVLNFSQLDEELDDENFSYRMKNWVQFSIDLTGRKDQDTLLVPVKITVPIPLHIEPEWFVILHYHQDGTYEEIRPILNGDGTASFTVTSFSPFVFGTDLLPATGLKLNKEHMALEKNGDQGTLNLTVTPFFSNSGLIWSSDNENIATVEDGVVTAVGKGITTVRVTAEDNAKVSAVCTVAVAGTEDQESGDVIYLKDLGLWMKDIPDQTYTGAPVKPDVEIYDNERLLTEGKDYKLAWKNNLNAGTAQITVTGMGNYSGKGRGKAAEAIPFTIVPKSIENATINVSDYIAVPKKAQTVKPKVTDGKKVLKEKKDYIVEGNLISAGSYDTYTITVTGMGNYTGAAEKIIQTIDPEYMLEKATVTLAASAKKKVYTGEEICLHAGELAVKIGKKTLEEGTDYSLTYENNIDTGTATVHVIPAENSPYVGEKTASFTITGELISKKTVNGIPAKVTYTGEKIEPTITLTDKKTGEILSEDNYELSYGENLHVGKATVVITGKGNYTGTIKKTFTIEPKVLTAEEYQNLKVMLDGSEEREFPYVKGGVKPVVTAAYGDDILTGKTTWKNADKVTEDGKMASAILTFSGDYKGKITVYYAIRQAELADAAEMSAQDMVYQPKAGKYKAVPGLVDKNTGKKLNAGKDYEKNLTYTYAEGEQKGEKIPDQAILEAGTVVCVSAEGTGNYKGNISATYTIVKASVASATVKVKDQIYTGSSCLPSAEDVTVTIGKTPLTANVDYKIVEDGSDTVNAGTRTFRIIGIGDNYGGMKTVKFKIKQKSFLWWFFLPR